MTIRTLTSPAITRQRFYSSDSLLRGKSEGWQALITELYGDLDIDIDHSDFSGEIRRAAMGRLELTRIRTDGEKAHRRKQHVARSGDDFFMVGLSLAGEAGYQQHGRECVMTPGHFGLMYSGAPSLFVHSDSLELVCLRIPSAALLARVADPHSLCSVARPIRPGVSRLVTDLLVSLTDQAGDIGDGALPVMEGSLLDMIAILLNDGRDEATMAGTSVRWAIHRRATTYMAEVLAQTDLTPDTIADGLGISTRYLHRIFEDADETVTETLMRLRLERARDYLADPSLAPLSIKEVAGRNGFKSQSHFASAFKARFGVTPRESRQTALS